MSQEQSLLLFNQLIEKVQLVAPEGFWEILQGNPKWEVRDRLYDEYVNLLLKELAVEDGVDDRDKWAAVTSHAKQGILLGFDWDGAITAIIEYLWDREHGTLGNKV
ncbi:hypothetical protein [Achromobacter sp. DH1f]|uniref:hypothetical protein n=1 Tax=Achromobacter sp. DH1f TaxID=1397275 RepID=UPI0012FE99F5|nr:hypothetical protein [Achromobacter sp. DH1f]